MFLTYLLRVGRLEGWSIVGEHQTRNLRLLLCIVKILRRVYRVVLGIDILEGYRRWIDSCVASGTEGSGLSRHSVDKDVQWCCGVCTDVFFSFQGTPPPSRTLKTWDIYMLTDCSGFALIPWAGPYKQASRISFTTFGEDVCSYLPPLLAG